MNTEADWKLLHAVADALKEEPWYHSTGMSAHHTLVIYTNRSVTGEEDELIYRKVVPILDDLDPGENQAWDVRAIDPISTGPAESDLDQVRRIALTVLCPAAVNDKSVVEIVQSMRNLISDHDRGY